MIIDINNYIKQKKKKFKNKKNIHNLFRDNKKKMIILINQKFDFNIYLLFHLVKLYFIIQRILVEILYVIIFNSSI